MWPNVAECALTKFKVATGSEWLLPAGLTAATYVVYEVTVEKRVSTFILMPSVTPLTRFEASLNGINNEQLWDFASESAGGKRC